MKLITFLGLLLVAPDFSEQIELSPVCPDSKEKTYHESLLPNTDYYVCENGFVTDFVKCKLETFNPESECADNEPCCKTHSTENNETTSKTISTRKNIKSTTPETRTTPVPTCDEPKLSGGNKIELSVEECTETSSVFIDFSADAERINTPDIVPTISSVTESNFEVDATVSNAKPKTLTPDEPKLSDIKNIESSVEECTETSSVFLHTITDVERKHTPNVESTTSSVSESNLNIATDISNAKPTADGEPDITSLEPPTKISNSGENFKKLTREVIIPIIEDIVNDYGKMSTLVGLFRHYFHAFLPLLVDIMELSEEHPSSGSKLSIQQVSDVMNKIKDTRPLLEKALLENLPSICYKFSKHRSLLLDAIEETQKRYQVSFLTLPTKYLSLILDYSKQIPISTDEFVTFRKVVSEVHRDIEALFKIVIEVMEDQMFSEKFKPNAIIQLFRF